MDENTRSAGLCAALRDGNQCDEEGIFWVVSREACHKAADRIEALEAVCADLLGIARAAVSERGMSEDEYRQAFVMVVDTLDTALQENTDG